MERLGLKNQWLKKKRTRKQRILICFVFAIIPLIIFEIFTLMVEPTILALCEIRARSIGISVSSRAISEIMSDIGYLDLINLERNENGEILALRANVIEMNKISSAIGVRVQEIYDELDEAYIKIPIGNFTGNALLAGVRT